LSPHANKLDCLRKAKETLIVLKTMKSDDNDRLRMPTDSIVSWKAKKTVIVLKSTIMDDHDGLHMPTDLIVSGRQKRL